MALIKIASLWKNEKDGTAYYSGSMGEAKIMIFENTKRDPNKRHPTHILYVSDTNPERRKEKRDEAYARNPSVAPSNASYDNTVHDSGYQPEYDDTDIPF